MFVFKWLRKLYDWVLHWAETRYGTPALGILSFAESSFFPVPPDVLLIALGISKPKRAFFYAFICSLLSVIGGMAGYFIGFALWEAVGAKIVAFYHAEAIVTSIRTWYDTWGFLGILIAAITPIPYKVFTIASGLFVFNFPMFVLASVIGRSFRFFLVSTLIFFFGEPIKKFIDKYFNMLTIVFTVLLVGGVLVLTRIGGKDNAPHHPAPATNTVTNTAR